MLACLAVPHACKFQHRANTAHLCVVRIGVPTGGGYRSAQRQAPIDFSEYMSWGIYLAYWVFFGYWIRIEIVFLFVMYFVF